MYDSAYFSIITGYEKHLLFKTQMPPVASRKFTNLYSWSPRWYNDIG